MKNKCQKICSTVVHKHVLNPSLCFSSLNFTTGYVIRTVFEAVLNCTTEVFVHSLASRSILSFAYQIKHNNISANKLSTVPTVYCCVGSLLLMYK